jgi:tRNA G10  N-methylase Trm11
MAEMLRGCSIVIDPFGGTGKVVQLRHWLPGVCFVAGELELEWARPGMVCQNSRRLPYATASFDGCATSPAYGNRMADKLLRDPSKTKTYACDLGHELSRDNGAAMQWGAAYRELHLAVWRECARVLRPGAVLALNMKDHIRAGERIRVTDWHVSALLSTGFQFVSEQRVACPGQREGANSVARVPYESVIKMRLAG